MSERTDSGYSGNGYAKDIDLQKSDKNSKSSSSQKDSNGCGGFISFISQIQEMSVQESKLENGLDKELFTLQKTICALWTGFKLGLSTMILIFLYIMVEFAFCFDYIKDYFGNNDIAIYFLKFLPTLATVGITLYLTTISRFAVGNYTNTAIKTFFAGKLLSTMMLGVIFIKFLYIFKDYLSETKYYLLFEAGINFKADFNSVLTVTFLLVCISAFAPFFIYAFRKTFFSIDRTKEYENY